MCIGSSELYIYGYIALSRHTGVCFFNMGKFFLNFPIAFNLLEFLSFFHLFYDSKPHRYMEQQTE